MPTHSLGLKKFWRQHWDDLMFFPGTRASVNSPVPTAMKLNASRSLPTGRKKSGNRCVTAPVAVGSSVKLLSSLSTDLLNT